MNGSDKQILFISFDEMIGKIQKKIPFGFRIFPGAMQFNAITTKMPTMLTYSDEFCSNVCSDSTNLAKRKLVKSA